MHQWIAIRDLINGRITCDYALQTKELRGIFKEIDRSKSDLLKTTTIDDIKSFKIKARQLVWDLMEMK